MRQLKKKLDVEIKETTEPGNGGIRLELLVEGKRVGTAEVTSSALPKIMEFETWTDEKVTEELAGALFKLLEDPRPEIIVSEPKEEPNRPLCFTSRFTYRTRSRVTMGIVYYDVQASVTGPEDLPAVVRNKMRFEVHRKLTIDGKATREILDLLK